MADPQPTRNAELETPADGRRNSRLSWLLLFVVATAAISLVGVHLPPRVKMLGLFAIGHGLLAGWAAARLVAVFELPTGRISWSIVVFVVILCGQIGMALESQRLGRAAEQKALAANSKRAALLRILESGKFSDDPQSKQVADETRRTIGSQGTSFADYLLFRVSGLGIKSRRLAAAIWILEILLGSVAGTTLFARVTARRLPTGGGSGLQQESDLPTGRRAAENLSASRLEADVLPAKLE